MNFGETISSNDLDACGSQLDAGSLIQAERNKKALKRIQKKMMHAMSTLDWSQSSNISCLIIYCELTSESAFECFFNPVTSSNCHVSTYFVS